MRKPIIGISSSTIIEKNSDIFSGYERTYVNDDYVSSVTRAGGVAVILPIVESPEDIKEMVGMLDGLILMGGHDVDPIQYNEEPTSKIGAIYPKRDRFDLTLVKEAFEKEIPILGICRGHQIINVAFGGSLYQDLSFVQGYSLDHVQKGNYYDPIHSIDVKNGTKLNSLVGNTMRVNSFHHLAVKDLAENFVVSAVSKDNIVEAIEYNGDKYVMGVQFHPEMMSSRSEQAQNIFNGLVNESIKRMNK